MPSDKTIGLFEDSEDCFVATASYGDVLSAPVVTLRAYRDQVLTNYAAGRQFIKAYYRFGPHAAAAIRNRPRACSVTRRLLAPLVAHADKRLAHN